MPALTTREAARERLLKMAEAAIDRLIGIRRQKMN